MSSKKQRRVPPPPLILFIRAEKMKEERWGTITREKYVVGTIKVPFLIITTRGSLCRRRDCTMRERMERDSRFKRENGEEKRGVKI